MKPLCVDIFCGLGGWAEGFLAEDYEVIGFDIERRPYPGQLVLQDVVTLDGSQFRDAACIVASPPCQGYSYRAMPWKRAKALPPPDNTLFEACFRIQREASEAAGRYIPMVVENVCGAQKWVGRARWHYGSYYLWGDVPALMPFPRGAAKVPGLNWNGSDKPGYKAKAFNTTAEQRLRDGVKGAAPIGPPAGNGTGSTSWFFGSRADPRDMRKNKNGDYTRFGLSDAGLKFGGGWWHDSTNNLIRKASSRSQARMQASAEIAKIPFALAQWIAKTFKPRTVEKTA